MRLEEMEILLVIETKDYHNFKEKIAITKKYGGKAKLDIQENYIYIETKRYVS